jgi:hypothetical protein
MITFGAYGAVALASQPHMGQNGTGFARGEGRGQGMGMRDGSGQGERGQNRGGHFVDANNDGICDNMQ